MKSKWSGGNEFKALSQKVDILSQKDLFHMP